MRDSLGGGIGVTFTESSHVAEGEDGRHLLAVGGACGVGGHDREWAADLVGGAACAEKNTKYTVLLIDREILNCQVCLTAMITTVSLIDTYWL